MATKKKVVYQITRTKYQMVEVETLEDENIIKELNRDFERNEKREKVIQKKCISLEYLHEKTGYEPVDTSITGEQAYEKEIFNERLHQAIDSLTKRQKEIVIKVYFEDKSQVEIARELGVSEAIISKTMKRALSNLKKFLEEKQKNF